MRRLLCMCLLLPLTIPAAAVAQSYSYVAEVSGPRVLRSGEVLAGSLTWACKASTCTIAGPWPTPGVSACSALAAQVGRLGYYGHADRRVSLSEGDLAECNRSAAIQGAPVVSPGKIPAIASGSLISTTPPPSSAGSTGSSTGVAGQAATRAERFDLRARSVQLTTVTFVQESGRPRFDVVNFSAVIENEGTEVYGYPVYASTQLYAGEPGTGLTALQERGGRSQPDYYYDTQLNNDIVTGLRPNQTTRASFSLNSQRAGMDGTGAGLWHTIRVTINPQNDTRRDNNSLYYSFIVNREGRVTDSRLHQGELR